MIALSPGTLNGRQAEMDHSDILATRMANMCLSKAGLVIGSVSAATVKQANTVTYLNNGSTSTTVSSTPGFGVTYTKTTQEITFTAGAASNITANASSVQERCYWVILDNTGAGTIIPGDLATGAGNAKWPPSPTVADANGNAIASQRYGTIIGGVRIAVAAGSTNFVAGTTLLSNGALTVTYTDYGFVAPMFYTAQ